MGSVRHRLEPAIRRPLLLTAGWALLGSAACLTMFVTSTIPPTPTGRDIPLWLQLTGTLLSITMIPACAVIPVPLLVLVRRLPRASTNWAAALVIAGTAGLAIESLFIWRLVRFLATPYSNMATPSWHALCFGIGYLVAGVAMTLILAGAGWSARHEPAGA